jgi:hypothetical protein
MPASDARLKAGATRVGRNQSNFICVAAGIPASNICELERSARTRMDFHRKLTLPAFLCAALLALCPGIRAQADATKKSSLARAQKSAAVSPRISLTPRFVPGQTFRYEMEFETTTNTSRTGLASDPEGPSSLVVDWNAAVRMDVSAAGADTPGGIRLRTTYEKSSAIVHSDTFDPAAAETGEQYKNLEGKAVEFTLDAAGNVKYAAGIEGIVDSQKAAQSARAWIANLSASAGAPPGGVVIGQKWSSEQPAESLPIAGLVWHTDSEYLRNEPCHPPNPDVPKAPDAPDAASLHAAADCAVILANLSLVRSKSAGDLTPAELRKNGVRSEGKWTGSAQSLLYVSLDSGMVVSVTQTGTEEMDVKLTSDRNTSLRYAGTISSRSHVALVAEDSSGK